ncbi:MAG TPA: hypothetical protein VJM81_03760 [Rhizorhapis sp.]|nr:hypothetical protein [Rhizorhapis sp.]
MRRGEDGTRYLTVHRPAAHDGVGRALRSAFRQPENGLPSELIELLGKLNQFRA